MASATELFNIGSAVDPYGKFREAQLAPMQYDIKQANLEEQLREIRQDQEAQKQQQPGLGTMGGGATMPSGGLSGMAKTINPNWKLVDDDGMPTTAGQINDFTLQSIEEGKAGARLMKQAKFMEPGSKDQINTISEGRRLLNNSMMYRNKAVEIARNTQNDAIYAAATAKDQTQWDNAIKSYQASGLPLPQGIPTEFTPENVKKIAQLAPAALQSKISNDLLKSRQEEQEATLRDMQIKKKAALGREGEDEGIKGLPKTKDEREGYIARKETVAIVDDIKSLLDDPKYAKLINPTTKFTPALIANLQKNFPELSTKLARIQKYEFSIGGKALTKQEQAILEPIYGWKGLTAEALKTRLDNVRSEFDKRNRLDEATYPGFKKMAAKMKDIEGEYSAEKKQSEISTPTQGTAPQAALDYLKANPSQKEAFKAKYGYLPKGY